MGGTKRMMDDHEQQRGAAIGVALEAGVLERCKFHDDAVFEGAADITDAYKLGNAEFSKGELKDIFDDRKEMTDVIKEVVEDHPAEECPFCAKVRDED